MSFITPKYVKAITWKEKKMYPNPHLSSWERCLFVQLAINKEGKVAPSTNLFLRTKVRREMVLGKKCCHGSSWFMVRTQLDHHLHLSRGSWEIGSILIEEPEAIGCTQDRVGLTGDLGSPSVVFLSCSCLYKWKFLLH